MFLNVGQISNIGKTHSNEKFAHSVVYFGIYILWAIPISDVKDIKGKTLTGDLDRLIGVKVIDGKTKPSKFSNHDIPPNFRYFLLFLSLHRFSRVVHATDFREFSILLFRFPCLRETNTSGSLISDRAEILVYIHTSEKLPSPNFPRGNLLIESKWNTYGTYAIISSNRSTKLDYVIRNLYCCVSSRNRTEIEELYRGDGNICYKALGWKICNPTKQITNKLEILSRCIPIYIAIFIGNVRNTFRYSDILRYLGIHEPFDQRVPVTPSFSSYNDAQRERASLFLRKLCESK